MLVLFFSLFRGALQRLGVAFLIAGAAASHTSALHLIIVTT